MLRRSWPATMLPGSLNSQKRRRERRLYRPSLERLESRCLLAAFRWINPAGGDFAVAANWQDEAGNAGVPGMADDALILLEAATVTSSGTRTIRNLTSTATLQITGGTFTAAAANLVGAANIAGGSLMLNGASTVSALTLSSGSLGGQGTIDLTGAMTWTGGTLAANLHVTEDASLALQGAGLKILDNVTLANDGTVTWDGSGNLEFRRTAQVQNDGELYDLATHAATFNPAFGGSAGTIRNAGVYVRETGGGISDLGLMLDNTGTLRALAGTLRLSGGVTQIDGATLESGTWLVGAGATLDIPGATLFVSTADVTLAGPGANFTALSNLGVNEGRFTLGAGAAFAPDTFFDNSGHITVGPGSLLGVDFFSQSPGAKVTVQIGGRPASGNFGVIAAVSGAALDGTFELELTETANTQVSDIYTVIATLSLTDDFSSVFHSGGGNSAAFTTAAGAAGYAATAVRNVTDLAVTAVSPVLAPATPGQNFTVNWTVMNNAPVGTSVGAWVDSVYVSASSTFDESAVLVGRTPFQTSVPGGGSYGAFLTTPLPGLLPGTYYVFVRADSAGNVPDGTRTNNLALAPTQLNVNPPTALVLGATASSNIAADKDTWFQVDVPGGSALKVAATFAAAGTGELYVAYERIPQLNDAEAIAADPTKATQQIVLPTTQAGTYFIRARGLAAAGQAFTIKAESLGFSIQEVLHARGSNVGNATLTLKGTGFTPNTTVSLTPSGGGTPRAATSVMFIDKGTVYATFNLTGLATGSYDVRAADGGQNATANGAYTVTNTIPGILTYRLIQPEEIRTGEIASATLEILNPGDTDLLPSLMAIYEPDGIAEVRFAGDSDFSPFLWWLPTSVDAPAGVIPPGYRATRTVEFQTFVTAHGTDIELTLDEMISGRALNWDLQSMQLHLGSSPVTAAIPNDAWDALISNFKAAVGGTSDSYFAALRDAATYLASVGTPTSDGDVLLSYLLEQADNPLPAQTLATATDASFPTTGLALDFTREALQTTTGRYRLGRLGRGWVDNWDISISGPTGGGGRIVRFGDRQHFYALVFDDEGNPSYQSDEGDDGSQLVDLGTHFVLTQNDGAVVSFRPDGQLGFVRSADGSQITAAYDVSSHLASLTHSGGRALTFTWNAVGRIASVTDPVGRTTMYSYDAPGQHLTSAAGPSGTTLYSYVSGQGIGREHALATTQVVGGPTATLSYDTRGRMIGRQFSGGAEAVTYTYGLGGGLTVSDGVGSTTSIMHDLNGNVARERDGIGGEFHTIHDAQGRATRFETSAGQVWTYASDAEDRLVAVTNPLGHVERYVYRGDSELPTGVTDARGNTLSYATDAHDNALAIEYPGGGIESFVYDPTGSLVETVNRRGNAIDTLRNADGLVTRQVFADGSATVYTYNARSLLATATNSGGTTAFIYYPDDRLQRITYPGGRFLQFTYDAMGRRTQSVDQDGFTVNYVYDATGRLAELRNAIGGTVVEYTYDAAGRITRKDAANGTFTTCDYDADGRTESIVNHAPGGAVNSQFDYTYDAQGNVATMTTGGVTTTYGYDLTGQLMSVVSPGRTILYAYDAAGNRISVTDNGVATSYTVNNQNQVTAAGATTFTYDLDGNRLTKTVAGVTTNYAWDDLSRLTGVSSPGEAFTYIRDALGQPLSTTHNGQTTTNLIDPFGLGNVWAQYDVGGVIAHYLHGRGLEVRIDVLANESFYDYDLIGSAAGLTNAAGNYINRYSYLPFGETTTHFAGVSNPFTYVGRSGVAADGSGVFSMRFRSYDALIGGFVSNDPIGLLGGDLNVRRYVGNNPVSKIDPSGLACDDVDDLDSLDDLDHMYNSTLRELVDAEEAAHQAYLDSLTGGLTCFPIPRVFFPNDVLDVAAEYRETRAKVEALRKKLAELSKQLDDCRKKVADAKNSVPSGATKEGRANKGGSKVNNDNPNKTNFPAGHDAPGNPVAPSLIPINHAFENPSEELPLPKVRITQQLDPNIDWKTFQFGRVNLGGFGVNVPIGNGSGGQNTTTFSARVPGPVTWGVIIDMQGKINRATGLVTWDITALDPDTLEPVANRSRGLLPPEPGNPHSRIGQVYGTMATNTGVANGTQVFHSAGIAFNDDPPILTPTVSNTVDATPPTSNVGILPPTQSSPSFNVSWSGSDANGNAWYDVYVSDNGGPYTLFQNTAHTTSANFTGQSGHTYSFYSIATDNVGNPQAAPGPIRSTLVDSAPTVATPAAITPNPVAGTTGTLSVLGADGGGEAALTYTWSVVSKPTGAADPTFSPNGTNAAKSSTATFSQSGSYTLRATISDGMLSVTSNVMFTVDLLPAQNDSNRFDVNGDLAVNLIDLIDLITLIVNRGAGPAPIPQPADNPKLYADVNGDTLMNTLDLIDVITFIVNAPPPPTPVVPAEGEAPEYAEGEAADSPALEAELLDAIATDVARRRRAR